MAKKNGGLFGGLFDFNGDGKTDLGEEFIAYKIFEERSISLALATSSAAI